MGFVNGGLLALGVPLMAVPIIIHLLNRRRFRPRRWAAMEFLLAARKQNRRRVQVENLLLLLLRALLVLLIALIVGRPLVTDGVLAFLPGSGVATERVVIVDDSASLDQELGQTTTFGRQRAALVRFIEELRDNRRSDLLTVVLSSRPNEPVIVREPVASSKVSELLERASEWRPVDVPADLRGCVRSVAAGVASPGEDAPTEPRVLYMLSDLRRTDWLGTEGRDDELSQALELFQRGPDRAILIVDVAGEETANLGVVDFVCLDRVVATEVPARFAVTIENFGRREALDLQLMLRVGETVVPVGGIDVLAGGGRRRLELSHSFRDPGVAALSLELVVGAGGRDLLERDSRRVLSVEVVERARVLIVEGRAATGERLGSAGFLGFALAPPGDVLSGVGVKVIAEGELEDEELGAYHVVMLADVEGWPRERLGALNSFVKQGGGLCFFVGERFDVSRAMRDLYKRGEGLFPCALGELAGSGREQQAFHLRLTKPGHSLSRAFVGRTESMLRSLRFWRRFSVPEVAATGQGEGDAPRPPVVVMSFDDEAATPALVERSYGQGKVVLLNTSADRSWTNWPRDPSFLVMAQELVRALMPSAVARRNLSAGELLQRAVNPGTVAARARLRKPGYPDRPEIELFATRGERGAQRWLSTEDTRQAGHYRLLLTPSEGGDAEVFEESYAVNLPAREGDLTRLDAAALSGALPEIDYRLVRLSEQGLFGLTEGNREEFWRRLIMLFLILLVVEGALARHAAHHAVAAGSEA